MRLDNEEINVIESIIDSYKKFHKELNYYENILNTINNNEKTPSNITNITFNVLRAINSLKDQREKEKSFFLGIKKKYGEGTFNPSTFEYVLKS